MENGAGLGRYNGGVGEGGVYFNASSGGVTALSVRKINDAFPTAAPLSRFHHPSGVENSSCAMETSLATASFLRKGSNAGVVLSGGSGAAAVAAFRTSRSVSIESGATGDTSVKESESSRKMSAASRKISGVTLAEFRGVTPADVEAALREVAAEAEAEEKEMEAEAAGRTAALMVEDEMASAADEKEVVMAMDEGEMATATEDDKDTQTQVERDMALEKVKGEMASCSLDVSGSLDGKNTDDHSMKKVSAEQRLEEMEPSDHGAERSEMATEKEETWRTEGMIKLPNEVTDRDSVQPTEARTKLPYRDSSIAGKSKVANGNVYTSKMAILDQSMRDLLKRHKIEMPPAETAIEMINYGGNRSIHLDHAENHCRDSVPSSNNLILPSNPHILPCTSLEEEDDEVMIEPFISWEQSAQNQNRTRLCD